MDEIKSAAKSAVKEAVEEVKPTVSIATSAKFKLDVQNWSPVAQFALAAGVVAGGFLIFSYATKSKKVIDTQTDTHSSAKARHLMGMLSPRRPLEAESYHIESASDEESDDEDDDERDAVLLERRFGSVIQNPYVNESDKVEHYSHVHLHSLSPELKRFKNVKTLLIVKSKRDVLQILDRLKLEFPTWFSETPFDAFAAIGDSSRFYLTQIGPIALVSSGIGAPTMSILLQEITKLLVDAGAFHADDDNDAFDYDTSYVDYILVGSALGMGVGPSPPGTFVKEREDPLSDKTKVLSRGLIPVIVPTEATDAALSSRRLMVACGELKRRPAVFNTTLQNALVSNFAADEMQPESGKLLTAKYEAEALALASQSTVLKPEEVRQRYFKRCVEAGVRCVDAEGGFLAAFCQRLRISAAAVLSVTRDLTQDGKREQVRVSKADAIQASMDVICRYIHERLYSERAEEQKFKALLHKDILKEEGFGETPGADATTMSAPKPGLLVAPSLGAYRLASVD